MSFSLWRFCKHVECKSYEVLETYTQISVQDLGDQTMCCYSATVPPRFSETLMLEGTIEFQAGVGTLRSWGYQYCGILARIPEAVTQTSSRVKLSRLQSARPHDWHFPKSYMLEPMISVIRPIAYMLLSIFLLSWC